MPSAPARTERQWLGSGRSPWLLAAAGAAVAVLVAAVLIAAFGLGDGPGPHSSKGSATTTTVPRPLDVPALARRMAGSIVGIDVTTSGSGPVTVSGTGIVLSSAGLVVTTERLAGQTSTVRVVLGDGSVHTADLVASEDAGGIALIQVRGVQGLAPAGLSNTAATLGDEVVAIGSPPSAGASPVASEGVVAADGATATVDGASLDGLVQTDAVVSPPAAGGPLVDRRGHVVGMSLTIDGGSASNGYAIPVDTLRTRVEQLEANQGQPTPQSPTLGVKTQDVASLTPAQVAANAVATSDGAMITEIDRRSSAHDADLRVGDVITAVDAQVVNATADLVAAIATHHSGDQVVITYERRGQIANVKATLLSRADTGN